MRGVYHQLLWFPLTWKRYCDFTVRCPYSTTNLSGASAGVKQPKAKAKSKAAAVKLQEPKTWQEIRDLSRNSLLKEHRACCVGMELPQEHDLRKGLELMQGRIEQLMDVRLNLAN